MTADAHTVTSMRLSLGTLLDRMATFVNASGNAPDAHSQAAAEIQDFHRPESVRTAHGQGAVLIEVAADQLSAFLKTITEPVETIAPWTCVRSLLEAAALACWLFDPQVDVRTRVGRSLALRYEGLDQQAKWATAAGHDPKRARDRIIEVEVVAATMGFEPIQNRNGRRIGIGQKMPSATELIRSNLNEEALYRLLSAIAHGHNWALQRMSFEVVSPIVVDARGVKVAAVEKVASVPGFAFLILHAATAFAKAGWRQASYFGWDAVQLTGILEASFDDLRAEDTVRFWRSEPTVAPGGHGSTGGENSA